MARRVFFSFKYEDVSRAMVVRHSWVTKPNKESAGFIDKAEFEKVKQRGDQAIKNWIDDQLKGTSVTVVLVGEKTCQSKWVKYEIEESIKRGNGLLEIDVSKIKCMQKKTTSRCNWMLDKKYSKYLWNNHKGHENLGGWVEKAALDAGRN